MVGQVRRTTYVWSTWILRGEMSPFSGKKGQVVLDQIRTVDKSRLVKRLGVLPDARARGVADVLREMFVYGD